MGYGPVINGKQKPITPYEGSWAHQEEMRRGAVIAIGGSCGSGKSHFPAMVAEALQGPPQPIERTGSYLWLDEASDIVPQPGRQTDSIDNTMGASDERPAVCSPSASGGNSSDQGGAV